MPRFYKKLSEFLFEFSRDIIISSDLNVGNEIYKYDTDLEIK